MLQTQIWERREDESPAAFEAFKLFLQGNRKVSEVVKKLKKSASLIYRWAHENNWQERSIAYDNSIIEETRLAVKQALGAEILRQWKEQICLQKSAFDALKEKDLSKASVHALSEIYFTAQQAQWQLIDRLHLDDDDDDAGITIEIVDATK